MYKEKHNLWLNQGEGESNEEYNKRIADFEDKEANKQFTKIAMLEELQQWIAQEKKNDLERDKNIPNRNQDFVRGFRIALDMFDKMLESEIANREVIMHNPTKYELKRSGLHYKLSVRK